MGCFHSTRLEKEDTTLSRLIYMKQFVKARTDFSNSHAAHLMCLKKTGAALLQFATTESPMSPSLSFTDSTSDNTSDRTSDLLGVIKELDKNFQQAAVSGKELSVFFEAPAVTFRGGKASGKPHAYKLIPKTYFCSAGSHRITVQNLLWWEKKLSDDVTNVARLELEFEKRREQVKILELKTRDNVKLKKAKKEIKRIEREIIYLTNVIEQTSQEIMKLVDDQLYSQLVQLIKGLRSMWEKLFNIYEVQKEIVQKLNYDPLTDAAATTTEDHYQSTLQLKLYVQQWHVSFCDLIKTQQYYIQSLIRWLRSQIDENPSQKKPKSAIFTLCQEFQLAVDNASAKDAAVNINTLLNTVHKLLVNQGIEMEKGRMAEAMERKYGSDDDSGKTTKHAAVLRAKAKHEKAEYQAAKEQTRRITSAILQLGLPQVFQKLSASALAWTHACEKVMCKENESR